MACQTLLVSYSFKSASLFEKILKLILFFREGNERVYMAYINPYQSHGMASFPGHKFVMTRWESKEDVDMKKFSVNPEYPLNVYNAITEGHIEMPSLSQDQKDRHFEQLTNIDFAQKYKDFTGSEWLAMFPKAMPTHPMWRADYFRQSHSTNSKENYFIRKPPSTLLTKLSYQKNKASRVEATLVSTNLLMTSLSLPTLVPSLIN